MTRLFLWFADWRERRNQLAMWRWAHIAHRIRVRDTEEHIARMAASLNRAGRFTPPHVGDWP